MKTEISKFCESCLTSLLPLPDALNRTVEEMEQAGDVKTLEMPLAALNDVRARLRSLVEKLENQNAYLLIFGPLKSGKSTLMNAISGSYVSEVTSLPGYPCLVFVRNAEAAQFSVTRYNGRESVFTDSEVLRSVVEDGHHALAEQMVLAETRGVVFDPRTQYSEAIRRIDIKAPVRTLAESSTVLVDTPGLYSRMNFGYDVLTREFRDTAACAVFVVKTDNLFLEQVFAEFNQLLDLFSRIFLVINVDSHKRDLQPDGSLKPSAESEHPESIIEAFKTLSMAGPLRRAYEQNRVRIHAVDLMSAASAMLSGQENGAGDGLQPHAFGAFQRDLTDYLNSSDYTREFIRDSLRQGNALCEEMRWIHAGDEVREVKDSQVALKEGIRELDERIAAVDRLMVVDWNASFEKARTESAARSADVAKAKSRELSEQMRVALDEWFLEKDSLGVLVGTRWNPVIASAAQWLGRNTRNELIQSVRTPYGGAEPAASVVGDLLVAGFDVGPVADVARAALDEREATEPYATAVKLDQVPVKKTFGDWILFRSAASVRRRLFGENLESEIAPEMKAKRLMETSREALSGAIDEAVNGKFPLLPGRFSEKLLASYITKFRDGVVLGLEDLRTSLEKQRTNLQRPFDANIRILASLSALDETSAAVSEELNKIAVLENVSAPEKAEIEANVADAVPQESAAS
ncbi:MAG: GTPase domain-containing protein [Chthoniobacteraceae bacterium]